MTLSDYVIDISLIAVVALQLRGRRLTLHSLLLPVVLVAWAASSYLHSVPTAGNDLLLVVIAAVVGTALGALCGLSTTVKAGPEGHAVARAGVAAAVLWVLGVGTRFAFQLYVAYGGAPALERFSASHSITSGQAWVAALVLMAMGEALARTAVLAIRARSFAPWRIAGARSIMSAGDSAF